MLRNTEKQTLFQKKLKNGRKKAGLLKEMAKYKYKNIAKKRYIKTKSNRR